MKYFLIIGIISGLLLHTVIKTVVLIDFQLNREEIAKNLCVKRTVKNNKCKGSCHLKRNLEQKDKQEQKLPIILKEKTEVLLYCNAGFNNLNMSGTFSQQQIPVSSPVYMQPIRFSVFHPPQIV